MDRFIIILCALICFGIGYLALTHVPYKPEMADLGIFAHVAGTVILALGLMLAPVRKVGE